MVKMKLFYEEGAKGYKYSQWLEISETKYIRRIIDAQCTCQWGTIHSDAWRRGNKICKHLLQAIKKWQGFKNP